MLLEKLDARIVSGLIKESESLKSQLKEVDDAMARLLKPYLPEGVTSFHLTNTPEGTLLVPDKEEHAS